MGKYHSDQDDINFNLIDVLKIHEHTDYGFAENDIKDLVNQFDKFVEGEVFPSREKSDEEGVKLTEEGVIVSESLQAVHKNYHDNGWFALGMPEAIGGAPVQEALYAACSSLAVGANTGWMMYPGLSRAALNVIHLKGNDYLKNTYVAPMMEGRWGGTMCLTESGAGSDVGALRSTATPIEGDKYNIKGVKIFISGGESDLYENNVHLVLARTPGAPEGTKGISLFVVPRFVVNEDGSLGENNDVKCTKIEHKMGIHCSATCEVTFGTNGNCEGYLIGGEFEGMSTMFIMMNEARLYCGIQGESQANLTYLMSLTYSKERGQFGKEIVHHPDVKRLLLSMRARARGMRALALYTANLFDLEKKDHKYKSYIEFLTPVCKSYFSDEGFNVSVDSLQVHGGYGYCTEYGVEQFVRDTKIASIYEGTNGIQAIDFVMRKILKDEGKTFQDVLKDITGFVARLDSSFANEQKLFTEILTSTQSIAGHMMKLASEKNYSQILQHATNFQQFMSYIVVAWRLGESALVAQSKNDGSSAYLKSKEEDFRVYCSYELSKGISLARSLTDLEVDITNIEI